MQTLFKRVKLSQVIEIQLKMEEEDQDFLPLQPLIVGRLISRLEDHPVEVHQDFANWKTAIASIQQYLNSCDRTRIFELDSYQSPKIIVEVAKFMLFHEFRTIAES